jgi:hypothetical protein
VPFSKPPLTSISEFDAFVSTILTSSKYPILPLPKLEKPNSSTAVPVDEAVYVYAGVYVLELPYCEIVLVGVLHEVAIREKAIKKAFLFIKVYLST